MSFEDLVDTTNFPECTPGGGTETIGDGTCVANTLIVNSAGTCTSCAVGQGVLDGAATCADTKAKIECLGCVESSALGTSIVIDTGNAACGAYDTAAQSILIALNAAPSTITVSNSGYVGTLITDFAAITAGDSQTADGNICNTICGATLPGRIGVCSFEYGLIL